MTTRLIRASVIAIALLGFAVGGAVAAEEYWVEPMKKVHAKFTGQRGTVAQIGDSITITMAFFTPLRGQIRNVPKDLVPAHEWIRSYVKGRCWAGWKGPQWGNNGRMTSKWGAANIDGWLKKMNPEVALIMFGTNDLHAGPRPPEYDAKIRRIARACIDNGTVPILYTIPPTANQLNNPKRARYVESFVESVRKVTAELKVPLIDYYKEMIARRPKDFPVLLGDNVHPSYPKEYQRDFSDEALKNSGYTLRNYLTLQTYWQVYRQVLSKVAPARSAAGEATWTGPTHQGLPAVLVPRPAAAPKIDGKLDDACWRGVEPIRFRLLDGDTAKPKYPTWAKVTATRETLFVAFHCAEPAMGGLISREHPHDGPVWSDDSVEVFVKAGGEATMQYYQVTANPAGSVYDAFARDKAWQSEAKVGTLKGKGFWSVEMALPFARMKLPTDAAALAGPWRLNLTRMRPARGDGFAEEGALSPTESPSSHVPAKFAYAFLEAFGGRLPAPAPKRPAGGGKGTSQSDERLRRLLRSAPEADANRDGVLTMAEARAWRQKMQARRAERGPQPNVPPPDVTDFSYGKAARQAFDLWQAKSARPTPLVLYIHGGGFRGGDKRSISRELLSQCREAGISYASINYRLTDEVAFPHTHLDAARALQTLRHNAAKWNLDPKRVASTGGSAGAGISMWLAFHDDLADPKSKDPLARQSTRLTCIAVKNGQCSYDHRFNEGIGLPGFEKHPFFLPFYGITPDQIDSPRQKRLAKQAAAITHLTKDDAPALLDYTWLNEPVTEKTPMGAVVHHPKFGVVLKERMDSLGIECIVQWPGHPKEGHVSVFDFIRKHFGMTAGSAKAGDRRP